MSKQAALFLDRDGVVIEELGYVGLPDDAVLIPGAAAAIARVNAAGIPVVVVTNQAGVGRGYFTETDVQNVHHRIVEMLAAEGAKIDRFYHCPHHPQAAVERYRMACDCRKPAAGMLSLAAEELGLALERSMLVGDKASDLQAALAAGCTPVLVETGYGKETAEKLGEWSSPNSIKVFPSIVQAAEFCLGELTTNDR
ncbi:MAG TPA: HAD family hydrolase [Pirellulales bacterium]|nr:HAD family hydrolase [Pirellulales bacterium]